MNNPLLTGLENWFSQQTDGTWEHGSGVLIETLDNPGWSVQIDPKGAGWADAARFSFDADNGENDWIRCWVDEQGRFRAVGDPAKLNVILSVFLNAIGREESTPAEGNARP